MFDVLFLSTQKALQEQNIEFREIDKEVLGTEHEKKADNKKDNKK